MTSVLSNLDLTLGHDTGLSILDIVTVHAPGAHERDGLIDTGLWDGIGGLDISGDDSPDGVGEESIGTGSQGDDSGEGKLCKSGGGHL